MKVTKTKVGTAEFVMLSEKWHLTVSEIKVDNAHFHRSLYSISDHIIYQKKTSMFAVIKLVELKKLHKYITVINFNEIQGVF